MKHYLEAVIALAMSALLASTWVQAEHSDKMVIALKTDDFELTETDISSLAVGEAQTIETESGRIIDILRTDDGAEIYVDGELLEMDMDHGGLHEQHMIRKHVEIICDSDEDCDQQVMVLSGNDDDGGWVTDDGGHVIIHREIEVSCGDDDDEAGCGEHMDSEDHEVFVIRKEVIKEN